MKKYDLLVIGGGASGMMAAISAKTESPMLSVGLLEGGQRVGKKLLTTGNGRCNLTNRYLDISHYYSQDLPSVAAVLDRFDLSATEDFFLSLGIPLREGKKGKMYPFSLQAASVVDALRFKCDELGVDILTESKVKSLTEQGAVCENETYCAKAVVVACGGRSATNTGSDGSGFGLLQSVGHTCTDLHPAITPVRTDTEAIRSVKGLKVNGTITATAGDKSRTEEGEILFTDYGVSGPPVLQLSGFVAENGGVALSIDMMPEKDKTWIFKHLMSRKDHVFGDVAENLFLGLLHKRIGMAVIKSCGIGVNDSCSALEKRHIAAITDAVKGFKLEATGVCGYDMAQVTAGGILLSEFDSDLMSKKREGLFACGEVLDVYGDCGGYNLQWAWSSGYVAGVSAARYAGGRV